MRERNGKEKNLTTYNFFKVLTYKTECCAMLLKNMYYLLQKAFSLTLRYPRELLK